jgi:hypothetical protein
VIYSQTPQARARAQLAYIVQHLNRLPPSGRLTFHSAMVSHHGAISAARILRVDPRSHAIALQVAEFARQVARTHRITNLGEHNV